MSHHQDTFRAATRLMKRGGARAISFSSMLVTELAQNEEREPIFSVDDEGQCSLAAFVEANETLTAADIAIVAGLRVGQSTTIGFETVKRVA